MTPAELISSMGHTVDMSHYVTQIPSVNNQHATLVSVVQFDSARAASGDSWVFWVSTTFFRGATPPADGMYAGLRSADSSVLYIPVEAMTIESFVPPAEASTTRVIFQNLTIQDQARLRALLTRAGFTDWSMDNNL